MEEGGQVAAGALYPGCIGMVVADDQAALAGVVDLARRGVEQQRACGDRLAVLVGLSQAREQAPPVVDQGDHARHQPRTLEIAGGKPAPAPVVLEFVEIVLAVGAIAIQRGDGEDLGVERGDQHGVLVEAHGAVFDLGETQAQLSGFIRRLQWPGPCASDGAAPRRAASGSKPDRRKLASAPCQPWPASVHWASRSKRSMSRLVPLVRRCLNR